jgi:hypothetical protein
LRPVLKAEQRRRFLFLAGALMAALPFFHRSPDGLDSYLLDRWSPGFSVFLFCWGFLWSAIFIGCWIKNFRRSLFSAVAIFLGLYLGLVLISICLWIENRYSYLGDFLVWDSTLLLRGVPGFHGKCALSNESFPSVEDRVLRIDLDAEGFRNPSPVPDKIDIAFLGDSFTFGEEVNDEELYTTLLTKRLGMVGRNYGIGGTSQGSQLMVLQGYIIPKRPKWVVVQMFDNDPRENFFFAVWMNRQRIPKELENWPHSKEQKIDATDHTLREIPFGKPGLGKIRSLICRVSDRSEGFRVRLPDKTVHFNHRDVWTMGANRIPFLDLDPAVARRLSRIGGPLRNTSRLWDEMEEVLDEGRERKMPGRIEDEPFSLFGQLWPRLWTREEKEFFQFDSTRYFLFKIIRLCREHQIRVIVVRAAPAWLVYRRWMEAVGKDAFLDYWGKEAHPGIHTMDELLRSSVDPLGGHYVSVLEKWQNPTDFYYYRYNCHFNPAGHRAFADLLEQEIREKESTSRR